MELNLNPNASSLSHAQAARKSGPASQGVPAGGTTPETTFGQTDELDQTLRAQPNTRQEAVSRAKGLIADASYPPPETIKRIANLLAMHFKDSPANT